MMKHKPKIRKNVLEKNRKKAWALRKKGFKIAELPMVFHSKKKAFVALKQSKMKLKNKKGNILIMGGNLLSHSLNLK